MIQCVSSKSLRLVNVSTNDGLQLLIKTAIGSLDFVTDYFEVVLGYVPYQFKRIRVHGVRQQCT